MLQRLVLLLAAAVATRAAAVSGVPRPYLAALPVLALWAPTSLVILVSRYLSRAWDAQPVVLLSGLHIARREFRAWIAAQAAEGVLAGALVISLAGWLMTLPVSVSWLAPAFALAGAYAIVARILRVRLARGVVALAEDDPEGALTAVRPILAWRPLGGGLVSTARLIRVQALTFLEDRETAIAECTRVSRSGAPLAQVWRALLTAPEDLAGAREVYEGAPTRLLGEAWLRALLHDVIALHAGDTAALAEAAGRRRAFADRMGPRASALSDLIDAARLGLMGETPALADDSAQLVAWAATVWPTLWRLAYADSGRP